MDTIQEAMNELSATFAQRMDVLENELHKGATSNTTTSALFTDFYNFKTFILTSLRALQEQIYLIQQSVDQIEMRSRRKILLLHGVPEHKQEDTMTAVADIIVERLKLAGFKKTDIRRSHRMALQYIQLQPCVRWIQSSDILCISFIIGQAANQGS
ncbi:hypothetical protein K1T71_002534 [Dendrolimus kikuchii]|uniref:Uncharacterized protein n=1 Tax=Dendrolimus kikuchii TaxID=765133 RepID=A0ACC1DDZ6_9NEOP|nr:hypothetical protein K1T71_002534 [Dendrolimus kikuchii]